MSFLKNGVIEPSNARTVPLNRRPGIVGFPAPHDDHAPREEIESPDAEFISIPEWARRLGISNESAYKAARLGQIPGCFNIGRLYRVNWPVFVQATSCMRSGTSGTSGER